MSYPIKDRSRSIGVSSNHAASNHSECGVGALIPWADRLYYSTYLAMPNDGSGTKIGYIDANFADHTVLTTNGIHTARYIHADTNQLCIGCCVIEADGTSHTINDFVLRRISGFAAHIVSPATKVYAITMEGVIYEVDLTTYSATLLLDVTTALGLTKKHFKACWTYAAPFAVTDRLLMASNVQTDPVTAANSGALVAVDMVALTASVKLQSSCIEVAGNYYTGNGGFVFIIGKDHKSPFLGVMRNNNAEVYKYRFPSPNKSQDWYISQEWMRIRPVTTERMMMNAFGMWFHLSTWLANASAAGIENTGSVGTSYPILEPIARYIDTITDFCVFNGKFAIGTNNMSLHNGAFPNSGQPNSAIKFGDIEDIWKGGKPTGKGYIWYKEATTTGTNSTAMLIRGYDKKTLHFYNQGAAAVNVAVKIVSYSDVYTLATVAVAQNTLVTYSIPDGVGADWMHLATDADNTTMTAWLECA